LSLYPIFSLPTLPHQAAEQIYCAPRLSTPRNSLTSVSTGSVYIISRDVGRNLSQNPDIVALSAIVKVYVQ
jgi:hypothetical protein